MEITGPQTANQTCNWLQCYSWEVMDHPSYSPLLHMLIFHLFATIKKQLVGSHFTADINVKETLISWVKILETNFFYAKVPGPVPWWEKSLNVSGYYMGVS
jgi:hypothetical protein